MFTEYVKKFAVPVVKANANFSFISLIQFKDLHRTGSNLCTGPAGSINQAKLKRILLGYARYSPEVGYCQVS